MNLEFFEVNKKEHAEELAGVAKQIWFEYYSQIITVEQVKYMVENFQSANAIMEQILNDGYRYLLIIEDGLALGYIALKAEADKLFLSKLYLKKEFRGKGYFNKMLSFVEQIAKEKGLNILYLTVNKGNAHSIAVYQKKGFVITKEQVADIGNGFVMDDYVMEKII